MKWLLGMALLVSLSLAQAEPFSGHASIQTTANCFRGPFESSVTLAQRLEQMPAEQQERVNRVFVQPQFEQRVNTVYCRDFMYLVDDVEVRGVVVAPVHPDKTEHQLPVLIYNRGGNADFGALRFPFVYHQLITWAEQGYIVIASNYRAQDEFGGADVADVEALLPIIQQMPMADQNNIAMWGVSRGGMQSLMAVRNMPEVKALVFSVGVIDLEKELEFRSEMENVYKARIPDYANRKQEALAERSVVHWLDQIPAELPILILHGEQDDRVHVSNATRFAKLLEQRGQPHQLHIYPDAGHNVSQESFDDMKNWLQQHLQ
ncbi:alpha/beta hydrolase family protein [Alkalimonas amylolytica]|uniref:Prolyl oligopeptidase family protein n=1 Tax=Alkalimonas amylolytica TaxID=152573 RepID=A0A1H4C7X4_ALKAM|nr:prolyl oligopeptidase family serine peptidase [Alkalimonas amylolytica]SEA56545.1 Prolyl oligopeptidase family protein [Alkalimonas amylolytica]